VVTVVAFGMLVAILIVKTRDDALKKLRELEMKGV